MRRLLALCASTFMVISTFAIAEPTVHAASKRAAVAWRTSSAPGTVSDLPSRVFIPKILNAYKSQEMLIIGT